MISFFLIHYSKRGAIINKGSKLINRSLGKGFSMVELVVAMGIMSVLMLLGVSGMLNARTHVELDQIAEEIVTTLREAQNNSVAIRSGSCANTAKVWGVQFKKSTSEVKLISLCQDPTDPTQLTIVTERTNNYNDIDFDLNETSDSLFVTYAVPFAEAYVFTTNTNGCAPGGAGCSWSQTNSPTGDWQLITGADTPLYLHKRSQSITGDYSLTLNYKGNLDRKILINSTGDITLD